MFVIVSLLVALSFTQTTPPGEQTGRISGRVTLEGAGTPISGARIILIPTSRPTGPMGPPPQATTGQDGRFSVDRVAPGTYRLDAQKTGLAPIDSSQAPTITVAAGQPIDSITLQLQKGAVIAGRILDSAGEPMPDARVMAFRRLPANRQGMPGSPRLFPAPNPGTQTNDIGEFRLSGLPPGEYFVAAMPRPLMLFGTAGSDPARDQRLARTTLPTTYYPGTIDQIAAQPITVAAGAEVGNIFFAMQAVPAFRISGVVVDEEGKPVAGVMVMLMGDPRNGALMGPVGNATSREDGGFDIDGVPAGSYRANASIVTRMTGSGGGGTVSGGVVSAGVSGGVTWSSSGGTVGVSGNGAGLGVTRVVSGDSAMNQATEVVVTDADVTDLRVVALRPPRQ